MTIDDTLDVDSISNQLDRQDDNPQNRIISHLFDKEEFKQDGIDLRTELTPRQTGDITKLIFLSKSLNIPEIEQFVVKFMRLKVSTGRQGRAELIKAVENTLESSKTNSFMDKWGGIIGGR